jgi:ATP-dependent Clp protease ATP-binding subunit ClpC
MQTRFTLRARKIMQLAAEEARCIGHDYIGTEHILLGIVHEGSGVAANVLMNLEVSLEEVRRQIEVVLTTGPGPGKAEQLPQTPRAKKALEFAIEEAGCLNHNYIGSEHLLLGLMREGEGVAAQVLTNMGLKLENVREEVLNLLGWRMDEGRVPGDPLKSGQEQPAPTNAAIKQLDGLIEMLVDYKVQAIDKKDFEFAAQIRDEAEKLRRIREFLVRHQHRLPEDGLNQDRQ